jgi:DNA helicase-2/ATP-dependent DNA helicase PcrA
LRPTDRSSAPPSLFDTPVAPVSELLDGLNDRQRAAVSHPGGAMLVLAGAGSGKTRVITHRIGWLLGERKVEPWKLLAVTFTNKAAAEMRERVERLVGPASSRIWISTFHSMCLRILRRDGSRIGLEAGFNVYDSADQLSIVKRLLKEETGESSPANPRSWLARISRAKNSLESAEAIRKRATSPEQQLLAEVYRRYQETLQASNAADFDDLLVRTLELFREAPDVAARYADQIEHLLVDEYQDTNRPQYLIVKALSAKHGNICVVGDEDQSIYRFRGAEIRNILEFEQDHPDSVTIRLEQNYRSTGHILGVAGAVISNNVYRKGKTLWTDTSDGEKVELYRAADDRSEAAWVASRAREMQSRFDYDEIAVLYRTNAQSRQLEEVFRREDVPYQIVGSLQFYDRKEVKDVLAYLKLAINPADDLAFRRVVNVPARGIGASSVAKIVQIAHGYGISLTAAAEKAVQENALPARSQASLERFLHLRAALESSLSTETVAGAIETVLERIDYKAFLSKAFGPEGLDRWENIRSLVSAAVEFEEEEDEPSLLEFLDRSALVADADDVGARPGVTMMTIHCAKGLEFPVVFLVGLEENLFPHSMSQGSQEDLEEERRLCYVAMTRAEKRLFLSLAGFRRTYGQYLASDPSRFIDELPEERLNETRPEVSQRSVFERTPSTYSTGSGESSAMRAARTKAKTTGSVAPDTKFSLSSAAGEELPGRGGWKVGASVSHPRFGRGRVIACEGTGKHLKLQIQFRDFGAKKILPAYTKLKQLDT